MAAANTTPRLPSEILISVFIEFLMSSCRHSPALRPDAHGSLAFVNCADRKIHAERALGQRTILCGGTDEVSEAETSHETPVFRHRIHAGCGHPDRAKPRSGYVRGHQVSHRAHLCGFGCRHPKVFLIELGVVPVELRADR